MVFKLTSPAFGEGQPIPVKYTSDGQNVSPPLEWSDPPPGTKSFALIVEDPDAPSGTFRHWGLYNIRGERALLPEDIGQGPKTEPLGKGVNDFGELDYGGPAPPKGHGRPLSFQARGFGYRGAIAFAQHAGRHLEGGGEAHDRAGRTRRNVPQVAADRSSISLKLVH